MPIASRMNKSKEKAMHEAMRLAGMNPLLYSGSAGSSQHEFGTPAASKHTGNVTPSMRKAAEDFSTLPAAMCLQQASSCSTAAWQASGQV